MTIDLEKPVDLSKVISCMEAVVAEVVRSLATMADEGGMDERNIKGLETVTKVLILLEERRKTIKQPSVAEIMSTEDLNKEFE